MKSDNKKFNQERFEFMLRINGNPICQRYFDIRGFNKNSIKSLELKEMVDRIVGMNNGDFGGQGIITKFLKKKSEEYLWGYYNPWSEQTIDDINRTDIFEKEDIFTFEFRIDNRTIIERQFIGNYFPPRVRYQVNIKEIIPEIVDEIRNSLSGDKYEKII